MNGFDMTAADNAAHTRPSERMIKMSDLSATDIERLIEHAHVLRSVCAAQLLRNMALCTARQARSAVRHLHGLTSERMSNRPRTSEGGV